MKTSFFVVAAILVSMFTAQNSHADGFAKQGSFWLGGGFNYTSLGNEYSDDRTNILQISPIVRFFPFDYFMIGPSFSWTGMFTGDNNINMFGIGADLGCTFNVNDKVYPYFRTGANFIIEGISEELYGERYSNSVQGFSMPIAGGVIIPVGRVFAFQIEPAFTITWIEGNSMNSFGINIGICGIGEKSAVSFLQGLSGLPNIF